ncbi:hypothetical protein SAMN05720781_1228 [Fibrobacter sp. UWT3]|nr:hypothetical protein SAMN05720781_1228 [Fibrobacter sp. UWT3]
MLRRMNAPLLCNFAVDERRKIFKGEGLPLVRTSLLATPSSGGSVAAPATPRLSIVYRLSSIV